MFNPAQHLLLALGVDPFLLMFGAWKRPASPSFTKRGPGRRRLLGKPAPRLARASGPNTYAEHDRQVTARLNSLKAA